MGNPDSAAAGQAGSVAFIITHTIKAGGKKQYEHWLADILGSVSSFPGYLGREIFRPAHGKRKYTSIVRFDSMDHLNAWAKSDVRNAFINRVDHLLEDGDVHEIRTGLDFWFTAEGVRPPRPWKQFLLTVSAVYPLSLVIPELLDPLFRIVPSINNQYARGLLVAVILTGLLTFVVMPHYTRLVKRWLFAEAD